MYKAPRIGWAQEFVTTLKFITIGTMNTIASTASSYRLTTNAFDIDPALGGTAMPGFTEYAAFYSRFRTLRATYKVEFMNREAFNVLCYAGFSNSAAAVVGHTTAGQALWKTGTMGPLTGSNKATLFDSRTIVEIAGTQQPLYDDVFTGSTTATGITGSGLKHMYFVIESPNAVFTATGGADYKIIISLTIQFYTVNTLTV